jgi:hypothetical protein
MSDNPQNLSTGQIDVLNTVLKEIQGLRRETGDSFDDVDLKLREVEKQLRTVETNLAVLSSRFETVVKDMDDDKKKRSTWSLAFVAAILTALLSSAGAWFKALTK